MSLPAYSSPPGLSPPSMLNNYLPIGGWHLDHRPHGVPQKLPSRECYLAMSRVVDNGLLFCPLWADLCWLVNLVGCGNHVPLQLKYQLVWNITLIVKCSCGLIWTIYTCDQQPWEKKWFRISRAHGWRFEDCDQETIHNTSMRLKHVLSWFINWLL
jgi:hypothetical protein